MFYMIIGHIKSKGIYLIWLEGLTFKGTIIGLFYFSTPLISVESKICNYIFKTEYV
jgi:hypothetical protein